MYLTKQEKTVVFFLFHVLFWGACLHYTFIRFPQIRNYVNLTESDQLYRKINVNQASVQELMDIPYIGAFTAEQIMRYRRDNGSLQSLEELKTIRGIKQKNFERFSKYLTVK